MRTRIPTAAAALMLLGSGAPLAAQSAPVPASASTTALSLPITFTGEVRSRTEWDAPGGAAAADLFSMLRTRFGVRVDPTPNLSVVLQLQDSRVLGTEISELELPHITNQHALIGPLYGLFPCQSAG